MFGPVMMEMRFLELSRIRVICHKHIIPHHLLYHRMTAALDLNDALFIDLRLHIVASGCHDR